MSTDIVVPQITLDIPVAYYELFEPWRYKVFYGGRDAAKSWSFAGALTALTHTRPLRVLCTREYQSSIRESVHKLLKDRIRHMSLEGWFYITDVSIKSILTGSEFIFKGLHRNSDEIKSTEAVDICWVEEGQAVTKESWDNLIPTIRKEGSEIWVSFNPKEESDNTYQRFVIDTPDGALVKKVSYRDNLFTTPVMVKERENMRLKNPEDFQHIYEGFCITISDAVIFKNKYVVEDFDTPTDPEPIFYQGADFGYGTETNDPPNLIRCYITDEGPFKNPWKKPGDTKTPDYLPAGEHLWVDMESYPNPKAGGITDDDLVALYDEIPTSRTYGIKADASRPQTIEHLRRKGFPIGPAEKWPGSVDDGIYHLKQFVCIHIHSRCRHAQTEAYMYRYKVDKMTGKPLNEIIDAWNHFWDALRYALDGKIQKRGALAQWANL